jgi:hypothetical protein
LTDGGRDRKCDALYLDRESGIAVIAQGYNSATPRASAPSNKAADLNTAASWVFGLNYERMNDSLRSAAQELDQAIRDGEITEIELWYCHNLPESTNVQEELDTAARTATYLVASDYAGVDIRIGALEVGIAKLDEWYAAIQSPMLVADTVEVPIDGWFEEIGQDWTAVCVSIPATWLTDLHDTYGDKLFSANIRGYMPSRHTAQNINNNMEETARTKPGRFWAYNNGITALVHDYQTPGSHPGGTLRLDGIAIVNGAQTTGALSRSGSADLADVSVLARFIKSENNEIVDDIIHYNNSQNPIKPSDFRSTDRHQERLRHEFEAIPDATYFGARRGGQLDRARRPSNVVSSDTVAQCLASFHGRPGTGYHDLRLIWENDELYSTFFSDYTTASHIVFVYSLLLAIQNAKADLVQRDSRGELATDERETLAFFRHRGSQFLLVAAVASCIEIVLQRPVANRYTLSFGTEVSPAVGTTFWTPIVDVMCPFANHLPAAELRGSLRNLTRVDAAISSFIAIIRATERANLAVFREFSDRVHG